MATERFVEMQHQMQQNQAELQDYLKGLDSWQNEITDKDKQLKETDTKAPVEEPVLPPVRNSLYKKKKKKTQSPSKTNTNTGDSQESQRISGFDFKSWDKFDVDQACDDIDNQGQGDKSDSEYETDDEWEDLRKKQQAILMKDQGNQYFKEAKYQEAIECYTQGISADPSNALLPANRAMALLKQDKYAAAEIDSTLAISLDPTYTKAYQRRATARRSLNKLTDAKNDFQKVLSLEPQNKLAKSELDKINKLLNPPPFSSSTEGDTGIIKPIYKAPEHRSKKPLRRLVIEEVGENVEGRNESTQKQNESTQKQFQQKQTPKDTQDFDKFLTKEQSVKTVMSPADIAASPTSSPASSSEDNISEPNTNKFPTEACDTEARTAVKDESGTSPTQSKPTELIADETRGSLAHNSSSNLSPPSNTYQFQAHWKLVKNKPEEIFVYLKQINPDCYPRLLGEFLDASVLVKILQILRDYYIPQGLDIFPVLKGLSLVKRFGITVMFLSSQDTDIIKNLFAHLEQDGGCNTKEVASVRSKFCL